MFETITPVNNTIYLKRNYDNDKIEKTIENSILAQKEWSELKIIERVKILQNFVSDFLSREKIICEEISWQIGSPFSQVPNELKGFKERADFMLSIAENKLKPIELA